MAFNNYYNPQNSYYGNPYYMQQPIQPPRMQETYQPQTFAKPIGLQGKSVDSIDVVKAIDIPLDGSVSYFPLADGTAIITKQLQQDGTSKTIIYKPTNEEDIEKSIPKYITEEQFEEKIKSLSKDDYKEEIKKLNRQIEDLSDDIDAINKTLKKKKEE